MAAPFARAVRASLLFESAAQRACCHASRPRKVQVRCLSSTPAHLSGHSKWSSIKHDKAKNDAGKSKQRSQLTHDITNAVKQGGPDPNMNARLHLAVATAKKSAVPKQSIEAAIARGQGLSSTGAALENLTMEAILPPSIATIIECQTDNKLRALAEMRLIVKEAGGQAGQKVLHMFEKKGRIVLAKKENVGMDEMVMAALEAGAIDVIEDEEGRWIIFTEPAETNKIADLLAKQLEMEIEESDIIYDPNDDYKVPLDDEGAAKELSERFLDRLQDVQGINGVYMNWTQGTISDEIWEELLRKVDV